jgi:coatomer subunit gamma
MNTQNGDRPLFDILDSSLRHQADMVKLEAARKITEMDVTSRELAPAITVLQSLLNSPRPVLRFAAVRTLNKVIHTCSSSFDFRYCHHPIRFLLL